jgi:hypothetical protein
VRSPPWACAVAQHSPAIALARLICALTILAHLAIGGSTTYAQSIRESAVHAGSTAVPVTARKADLNSLQAKAAAVTTIGRSVYAEAGRILDVLTKSDFPDEKVRAEAGIALREVVKASYHLAVAGEVLGDAMETAAAGEHAGSAMPTQALEKFGGAEKEHRRAADELQQQIRAVRSREAAREVLADEIAALARVPETKPDQIVLSMLRAREREAVEREQRELQALILYSRGYESSFRAVTAAISELIAVLAPPVTRETTEPGISLSVYGFFDQQGVEQEDYGLYTYVVLTQGHGPNGRNVAFLKELFASTGRTKDELAAVRRQLNIFYVPVQNRIQALVMARSSVDAAAAIAAPGMYDYEQAEGLLFRLCTETVTSNPKMCASAWRGPYLLTLPEPVSASATVSPSRLLVDLSDVHERAFREFIRALKEQVMRPDFTDRQKIDTVRLALLDITLKTADWLNPIKEGIAEIVSLGGETAR